MLGFNAFSETPFAQAATALAAVGYLTATTAQLAASTVLYDAQAGASITSVTASITASGFEDVDAKATLQLLDAIASFNINDIVYDAQASPVIPSATFNTNAGTIYYVAEANRVLPSATSTFANDIEYDAQASAGISTVDATFEEGVLALDAKASVVPSSAVGTFSLDIDYDAKANLTLGSVTSDILAYDLADVDAQANTTLSSTSAYLTIYITDFADEDAQARAFMSPAVAVGNVDVDFDAKANTFSSSVDANLEVSEVDFDAKANITTSTVIANVSINNFYDVDAQATANFSTLDSLILSQNLEDPTAVRFDFTPFTDSYDRNRTLYLVSYDENRTVQINPENRTVYIEKTGGSYTVNIAA